MPEESKTLLRLENGLRGRRFARYSSPVCVATAHCSHPSDSAQEPFCEVRWIVPTGRFL